MDLNSVVEVCDPRDVGEWRDGDVWLAGGTVVFGEPALRPRRLVDLTRFGWAPVTGLADGGVEIAATCTIAELVAWGRERGVPLVEQCCRAFLASFKVWNTATAGGNLCAALPAGPVIALTAALGGVCRVVLPDGGERLVADGFVVAPGVTRLGRGSYLRSIVVPGSALRARTAFRQFSLHDHGRSAALVVGVLDDRRFRLVITAAVPAPLVRDFPRVPGAAEVADLVAGVPAWVDDVHGDPEWRRHLTGLLAEQVRRELGGE
ncbi:MULTISPECIES: FAD binding domain-containing protein [Actinosynnema]|uniref:FAD-binding molybdopterin dehydrogenase n=1 Tax=Actinosynnema pretiosum TaxID=42197 RepID=A0A290Z559_9PSEU|nr:FAD binding domain-containing protein [Actinosynnema pretiosum]ATE54157.1 FAD-binding molybdopterin dehydrogenase [Actinosynnema pretiosum]